MAGSSGTSINKRQKEQRRQLQKQQKEARKDRRRAELDRNRANTSTADGVDPDIAHIKPGPQPIPE